MKWVLSHKIRNMDWKSLIIFIYILVLSSGTFEQRFIRVYKRVTQLLRELYSKHKEIISVIYVVEFIGLLV